MRIFRSFVVLALVVGATCASAQGSAPLSRHEDNERRAGDWLQYGIPLSAFALTFVLTPQPSGAEREKFNINELIYLNGSPRHDLLLAAGRAFALTEGLKYAIDERRPNGGLHSFPSGHTSIAFTGAEFIRKEYGWWWGMPAYAAAAYVGWSRVDAKEHHTRDVLASAVIGIAANHDFHEIKTRFGKLSIAPTLLYADAGTAERAPVVAVPGLNLNLRF